MLDAFVHIDAENTQYVYDWRLQQEAALRAAKGTGMTDSQVINFVNGCKFCRLLNFPPAFILPSTLLYWKGKQYVWNELGLIAYLTKDYPAYELYTETLRAGIFKDEKGKQLRLVVGKDRRVKSVQKL